MTKCKTKYWIAILLCWNQASPADTIHMHLAVFELNIDSVWWSY